MAKGANLMQFGVDVEAATQAYMAEVPLRFSISTASPTSRRSSKPRCRSSTISFRGSARDRARHQLPFARLAQWRSSWPSPCRSSWRSPSFTMRMLGIDLHRITLGALIIALGPARR